MSGLGSRLRCCIGVLLLLSGLLLFGQYEDPETAMRRADTALGQGRFDVAQSIYDGVLRLNPNLAVSPWRCRNIAEANVRATHANLKAATDWLQRAVDQAPNDNAGRERLAEILLQSSEPARAAAQYRSLFKKNPANPRYVQGLATALRNLGEYDEAASLLSSTLEKQPGDVGLRVEYARNLAYQHQFQAARDQFAMVLKYVPDTLDAQIGLAKVYSWEGNQQQALVEYGKALLRDPDNYDALVGQAFALIWSGRQNEALPILERANSRHPENAEVRDALKKAGGITILTSDVRTGEPAWPILSPSTKKAPEKIARAGRGGVPDSSKGMDTTESATEPVKGADQPVPVPNGGAAAGHSVVWVVGMGLATLVAVFAVAGFLLFFLPTRGQKKAPPKPVVRPAPPRPLEPWSRLEEFSRSPVEPPKPAKSLIPASSPLALSELLPAPRPPISEPEPEPAPKPEPAVAAPPEPATASVASAEPDTPSTSRAPRRRRGVTDRPWWRDLPASDADSPVNQDEPLVTLPPARPVVAEPSIPPITAPYDDGTGTVVVPADHPNPLTPAAERPAPPEEPPPARPFTMVLSRALERAGDGQAEEPADPVKSLESHEEEEDDYVPSGNGRGRSAPKTPEPAPEAEVEVETSQMLADADIVIVGCGVMVSHYRIVLKAAGADVRTFTFWDLAMSSMRKRRADVLLIDGDALDGLTPVQMYTSAQIERYMFGSILVGISSDEDRSSLPEDVVLPHSLTDDDLRNRFVASLQAS